MKLLNIFMLRIMQPYKSQKIPRYDFFNLAVLATLFYILLLPLNANAENAKVEKFEVKNSRAYAYHIGDTLSRNIQLQLRKPFKLKTDLLPKPKRMGRWLNVTEIDFTTLDNETSTQYDIVIKYQIINIISELKELALPRHYLTYYDSAASNAKSAQLEIPLSTIGVAAVTNPNNEDIQLDVKPVLLTQTYNDLFLYGGLLLLSLVGLSLLLWGAPFSSKEKPFSDALRSLKKIPQNDWDNSQREKALKLIHQAFNRTANKTVFMDKTGDFFSSQKHFLPLRKEIETFFRESKDYFFKASDDSEPSSLENLIKLVKSCKKIEQGKF